MSLDDEVDKALALDRWVKEEYRAWRRLVVERYDARAQARGQRYYDVWQAVFIERRRTTTDFWANEAAMNAAAQFEEEP